MEEMKVEAKEGDVLELQNHWRDVLIEGLDAFDGNHPILVLRSNDPAVEICN